MKPGSFTQFPIHLVFAVKYRECLLRKNIREELFKYVSGIVTQMNHKSLIVNGYTDHIHVFFGLNPSVSISDTVSEIKRASAHFINEKKWFSGKFLWQEGYGGFAYTRSHVNNVFEYVKNQEIHHQKNPFKDEYLKMLKKAEIEFEERFLPDFFDDYNID